MRVDSLFEYPVKGLRGNKVCCATVNRRGLKMDRRWMIVDNENSFLSQRQIPGMTNLQASFSEQLTLEDTKDQSTMVVDLKNFITLEEVEIWGQVVSAKRGPKIANQWLSEKLGRAVKIFYMGEENLRPVRQGVDGEIVSFADGYPILLTGTASLADLNNKLDHPVAIDRFRTNIHLETNKAFEEEAWQRLKIGDVVFKVVKKCARCTVINVDQQSGRVLMEPLKTLSTYRKEANKVNFGMNLIPETFGLVHEEDEIEILA